MPSEENKKKWVPRDLYLIAEFPEDERMMTVYDEPEVYKRVFVATMLLITFVLTAFFVMMLTGALRVPPGTSELANAVIRGGHTAMNISPSKGMPRISEISANNKTAYAAANGKYYDWIEIYNPTDQTIDLSGFCLSDNPEKPGKFALPSYALGSGKYVIAFASGKKSKASEFDVPFKLNSSGMLLLSDLAGNVIQWVEYPKTPKDKSYAMDMGDFSKWELTDQPTPGYPN